MAESCQTELLTIKIQGHYKVATVAGGWWYGIEVGGQNLILTE